MHDYFDSNVIEGAFFPVGPPFCFDLEVKVALCSRKRSPLSGTLADICLLEEFQWVLEEAHYFSWVFKNSPSSLGKTRPL